METEESRQKRNWRFEWYLGLFFFSMGMILPILWKLNEIKALLNNNLLYTLLTVGIPIALFLALAIYCFRNIRNMIGEKRLKKEETVSDKILEFIDEFHEFTISAKECSIYSVIKKVNEEYKKHLPHSSLFPEIYVKRHREDMEERINILKERNTEMEITKKEILFTFAEFISIIKTYTVLVEEFDKFVRNRTEGWYVPDTIKKQYLENFREEYNAFFERFRDYVKGICKEFGEKKDIPNLKAPFIWFR